MNTAVFIGIVFGWWLAARHIDHWLIIFYHFRYRTATKYLELYDLCDNEYSFQVMERQKHGPKSYAEFLLWHQKYRPKAGETFRKYWDALTKEVLRDYLLLAVLPAAILWHNWIYFLVSFLAIHIAYLLHRVAVKRNGISFYVTLINTLIISELSRSPLKKAKYQKI